MFVAMLQDLVSVEYFGIRIVISVFTFLECIKYQELCAKFFHMARS